MRPAVGASGSTSASPRKASAGDAASAGLGISSSGGGGGGGGGGGNNPTSFMLASESELDEYEQHTTGGGSSRFLNSSTYGVRSIEDEDMDFEEQADGDTADSLKRSARRLTTIRTSETGFQRDVSSYSVGPVRTGDRGVQTLPETLSQPLTPVSFASHAFESSVPSSPKSSSIRSFRHSDDDLDVDARSSGSQAIASSEDEADHDADAASAANILHVAPPQQLIMPSLIMPSRRPFTDRGNQIGRFKVMVAGPHRVGKTSLIKSIIQTCEDIVHVDSGSLQALQRQTRARPTRPFTADRSSGAKVTELYASTKAFPGWWTEVGGSDILQRRRSLDENILTRNLCFVDTPAFDQGTSILEGMEPALKYLDTHIRRTLAPKEQSDTALLSMLSGHGGSQVDVVLYLIDHDLKPSDIEYIRQLNHFSNVIPLLAKADTLEDNTIINLKRSAMATLSNASIPILWPPTFDSSLPSLPLTVCSCASTDLDAMDASILMQSEIFQPLRTSDLPHLVTTLFNPSTIAFYKHSAAHKILTWRTAQHTNISSPALTQIPTTSHVLASTSSSLATTRPGPHHRPTADQTVTDERVSQLRFAAWASSLQRSLAHERRRYERLAKGERLSWLRAQLDSYSDMDIDASKPDALAMKDSRALVPRKGPDPASRSSTGPAALDMNAVDPLGIVRFRDQARHTGWLVLQVAGSCGVLGAAVIWAFHVWRESAAWTPAAAHSSSYAAAAGDGRGPWFVQGWPADWLARAWGLSEETPLLDRVWGWWR